MSNHPAEINAFKCIQTLHMIENWANKKTGGIDWFEVIITKIFIDSFTHNLLPNNYPHQNYENQSFFCNKLLTDAFQRYYIDTIAERANLYRINDYYCKLIKRLSVLPREKRLEALDMGVPGLQPRDWLKWTQSVKNIEELLQEK